MTTEARVLRSCAEMRDSVAVARQEGKRIVLVPTMGYLHDGHLSLLRSGRERGDLLIMSLFVNPTQFGPNEDLDRYPRDEEGDLAKASECGVDLVFMPEASEMYPEGYQTSVRVEGLSSVLCGASRPGHFDGVATVVSKLFNICRPHVAVFGEKDYQQLAILRRMVLDMNMDVELVGEPIVREEDGLAMSSRNAYLSEEERKQALCISRGLKVAEDLYAEGKRDTAAIVAGARAIIASSPLARIDYLELRDAASLDEIQSVEGPALLAAAVWFGRTRLIDNRVLG